jgi:hypothetical protein
VNDGVAQALGFDPSDPLRRPLVPDHHPVLGLGEEYLVRFAPVHPDGRTVLDDRFKPVRFADYRDYAELWVDAAETARLLLERFPDVDRLSVAIGIGRDDRMWFPDPRTWPCVVRRRLPHRMAEVATGARVHAIDPH